MAGALSRLLVQVHRYVGLATMIFLIVAGATGAGLVFEQPLDALINPGLFRAASASAGGGAPIARAAAFLRVHPRMAPVEVPLRLDGGRAMELKVAAWPGAAPLGFDQAFVDPASLRLQGVRDDGPGLDPAHLMRGVYFLHYTLLAGDAGRWLMALAALAWFLNNLIGFYLTLPRGAPFWRRWKPVWGVNFRAKPPRLLLDLHRAGGLWLSAALVVTAFTSVALNTYSEVFAPLAIALSPPKPTPWDRPAPALPPGHRPKLDLVAGARAARAAAGGIVTRLQPAVATYDGERNLYGLRFTSDGRLDWRGLGPVSVYVDGDSGRLVYVDDPRSDSGGQQFLRALYPLHSGEIGGWATRLLVFLVGLVTVEMAVSGLYVWWKKRGPRVAMRAARRAEQRARGASSSP